MKLFGKLTIIFLVVSLIACKDDPPFNPLLGTWQYLHETYSNCDNATDEGRFDLPCNTTDCFKVTYNTGGKFTQYSLIGGIASTIDGTYSFDGTDISICSPGCGNPFTFSVTGSTLTFTRRDDAGCLVTTVLEKVN